MKPDDEIPEWTDAEMAQARPFREFFPEFDISKRIGRPPLARPKVHLGLRLAADVVEGIRRAGNATMRGWKRCCGTRSPTASFRTALP